MLWLDASSYCKATNSCCIDFIFRTFFVNTSFYLFEIYVFLAFLNTIFDGGHTIKQLTWASPDLCTPLLVPEQLQNSSCRKQIGLIEDFDTSCEECEKTNKCLEENTFGFNWCKPQFHQVTNIVLKASVVTHDC